MQSHFSDCRGIRSAKNGRWVLVLFTKHVGWMERGSLVTFLKIFEHLTPSKYLRMYKRTQNKWGNLHP